MTMKQLALTALLAYGIYMEAESKPPRSDKSNRQIITASDPSTFIRMEERGRAMTKIYDRRLKRKTELNVFLFHAWFDDGLKFAIRVNPEFGNQAAARKVAEKYARHIGQLPTALRSNVHQVTINDGDVAQGGGDGYLLIHAGRAAKLEKNGRLEEILAHEAAHASIAPNHKKAKGWIAAQKADGKFLNEYAENHPIREDIAVSFPAYMGYRYRPERLSRERREWIEKTIPHRIQYFDALNLEMYPLSPRKSKQAGNDS